MPSSLKNETGFSTISNSCFVWIVWKTRHAYYDSLWRKESSLVKEDVILQEVAAIRKELPRLGTRKLHYLLQSTLATHEISLGRDYLFDLLSEHKLLIRQRKRKAITTDSRHWMRKYSNLVKVLRLQGLSRFG